MASRFASFAAAMTSYTGFVSHQLQPPKARMAVAPDDEMVVRRDAERLRHVDDRLRHLDDVGARRQSDRSRDGWSNPRRCATSDEGLLVDRGRESVTELVIEAHACDMR